MRAAIEATAREIFMRPVGRILTLAMVAGLAVTPACSIKKLAAKKLGDAMVEGGSVYASDDDPELVRDAVPFALKTMESLLQTTPDHGPLLQGTCSSFTQYAWAFIETDAEAIEARDWVAAKGMRDRALRMYLRARGYCLRGLELKHRGISERLPSAPGTTAAEIGVDEIDLLYWTAASWGGAISLGVDRPEIIADVDVVRALMGRALELDESYGEGAIHQALISIEGLPEAMGGSPERAREHFQRALELSGGHQASVYVTFARTISVAEQDYAEFKSLLETALAIDPDAFPEYRLANLISRRRAEILLDQAEELFLAIETDDEP
jgi:tetratricopeptide (TPR) repeat protein